jgi:hypothetical protein
MFGILGMSATSGAKALVEELPEYCRMTTQNH